MLAGASAVEIASAVYERGLGVIAEMNRFVGSWMERHAFLAARDFVGRMNARNIPDPELYERTQFMKYYLLSRVARAFGSAVFGNGFAPGFGHGASVSVFSVGFPVMLP